MWKILLQYLTAGKEDSIFQIRFCIEFNGKVAIGSKRVAQLPDARRGIREAEIVTFFRFAFSNAPIFFLHDFLIGVRECEERGGSHLQHRISTESWLGLG